MNLKGIAITLVLLLHTATAKPRYRKQKRATALVNIRRFFEPFAQQETEKNVQGEMVKKELKTAMASLSRNVKDEAMDELLHMFGLQAPNTAASVQQIKKPPKYMVDLYNAVADQDGVTRAPDLLDADTVRSIPNIDTRCPERCLFDLRPVDGQEVVLDAELHIYFDTPHTESARSSTSYLVKIYQVYSRGERPMQKTLVAGRRLAARLLGWQIFPLLTSVETWNSRKEDNLGILVQFVSDNGKIVAQKTSIRGKSPILVLFTNDSRNTIHKSKKTKTLQVLHKAKMAAVVEKETHVTATATKLAASRHRRSLKSHAGETTRSRKHNHKNRKQHNSKPKSENHSINFGNSKIIGLSELPENITAATGKEHSSQDTDIGYKLTESLQNEQYNGEIWEDYDFDYASDGRTKPDPTFNQHSRHPVSSSSARFPSFSTLSTEASASRSCRRYPLYVDFEEMGWSGWIIHPQGYNAYHCRGKCSFPISQNLKPSNHATVQSIMHTLGLGGQPVDMPCCTPDKLYDINLLYFDHNDYVVLRRYKDMVAASCACR
uniref:TGF-beta family profile domain-containing protein n=1 Tax=Ciona savignyi TaxID=51511 RepID=H2YTZ7_CIOSA